MDEHNAVIIEDAAESPATYKGFRPVPSESSTVSFNGNKIITGSTGMLLTDDLQQPIRQKVEYPRMS